MKKLVTVAIPTYNRVGFVRQALISVINQIYTNIEILVVDNNSSDDTSKAVESFRDDRIRYFRNKRNIGMMNNWNKCIELSKGKNLMILGDDDRIYPGFLEKSLKIHKAYSDIGFSFTHCNKVDPKGKYLMKWGYQFTPPGYLDNYRYLYYTIKYGCCLTNSSTVLINKQVFNEVGQFEAPYGANTFDFNMWIKIALKYPVYFIDEVLCDYRLHKEQVSELHWRKQERPTGKIGTYLEILDAIARLLKKPAYYNSDKKRKFLLDKLEEYDKELSLLLKEALPEL